MNFPFCEVTSCNRKEGKVGERSHPPTPFPPSCVCLFLIFFGCFLAGDWKGYWTEEFADIQLWANQILRPGRNEYLTRNVFVFWKVNIREAAWVFIMGRIEAKCNCSNGENLKFTSGINWCTNTNLLLVRWTEAWPVFAARGDKMVDLSRRKHCCGRAHNLFIAHYSAAIQHSTHGRGKSACRKTVKTRTIVSFKLLEQLFWEQLFWQLSYLCFRKCLSLYLGLCFSFDLRKDSQEMYRRWFTWSTCTTDEASPKSFVGQLSG